MDKKSIIFILIIILLSMLSIQSNALVTTDPPHNLLWKYENLGGAVKSIAWNPRENIVAVGWSHPGFSSSGRVLVFDENGNLLWRTEEFDKLVRKVAWHPDGYRLAVALEDKIIIYDKFGNKLDQIDNLNGTIQDVAWDPTGQKLAITTSEQIITIINGTIYKTSMYNTMKKIEWHPTKPVLAVGVMWRDQAGNNHGKIVLYDEKLNILWITNDLNYSVTSISWHPNGTVLVAGMWKYSVIGGYEGKIVAYSYYGDVIWELKTQGPIYSVAWSPSGDKLAIGGYSKIVYILNGKDIIWKSNILGANIYAISWSKDSKMLAVGTPDKYSESRGKIYVYNFKDFGFLKIIGPNCCTITSRITDLNINYKLNISLGPNDIKTIYASGNLKLELFINYDRKIIINVTVNPAEVKIINLNEFITYQDIINTTTSTTTSYNYITSTTVFIREQQNTTNTSIEQTETSNTLESTMLTTTLEYASYTQTNPSGDGLTVSIPDYKTIIILLVVALIVGIALKR